MRDSSELSDRTRRTVLKAVAGTLGIGAMGTASAHDWPGDDESEEGPAGVNDPTHPDEGTRGQLENVDFVGYHALGGRGPGAKERGEDYRDKYGDEAQDPHYGSITEIRTHGDYAYVGMFSSDRPSPGRGMAIVDISDYNDIPADASESEQREMLERAELRVVSFLRNNNAQTAVMDVKVSDDGQYAFLSTQPYTVLFGTGDGNQQDPTRAEIMDPSPNTGDSGFTYQPGGVIAVDVSDKYNPETLGAFQLSGTGSHNAYYHRIDGDDYIFAIHDLNEGTEGMYVLRFDRSTGKLHPVNRWHFESNNRQGEATVGINYIHDVEIQNDPKTGTPVAYLAYWGRGLWALDVSDPENIEALGQFAMDACHFTSPAPTTIDGKRVAVASQEVSASDSHSGRIYLVDADGLFEEEDSFDSVPRDDDGVVQMGELDKWEWHAEWMYEGDAVDFGGVKTSSNPQEGDLDGSPYRDFSLSPHNSDFTRHADGSFWVHQSHYNGGVRFLRVDPGTDDGLVSAENRFVCNGDEDDPASCGDHGLTGAAGPHHDTDWSLVEEGWARPDLGTPQDSRMEGLNYLTPFCWAAVESNGITFASDINQGVYALWQRGDAEAGVPGIPVGGAPPDAQVSRATDGFAFTGGQTNQVDVTLDVGDDLLVRDRLPDGWEDVAGDGYTEQSAGGSTYIVFDGEFDDDETRRYFAEAPDESGAYSFGPVEVSNDGGATWHAIAGTSDTNYVVGADQNDVALGTVGAFGILAHQRDRIREKAGSLLDRE